jgi:hypothetical protein
MQRLSSLQYCRWCTRRQIHHCYWMYTDSYRRSRGMHQRFHERQCTSEAEGQESAGGQAWGSARLWAGL